MKTIFRKYAVLSVGVLSALNMSACAPKNSNSSAAIQLQMGSYTTSHFKNKLLQLLAPQEAQAAVSNLKMCFKRLRFKAADVDTATPSADASNQDFAIGEVTISNSGALLGLVSIPQGTYQRIEFDLDTNCASGKSIQLVNGNGSFSSTSTMTIKFRGNFVASADGALTLGVQTILTALNSYTGAADFKTTVESISGTLAN
ncbi:MAG: hypothetical protein H7061_05460 [Bdellovibrionaceae bacterium]|nr:hypothetical protein [Bdellovibrio sp.]